MNQQITSVDGEHFKVGQAPIDATAIPILSDPQSAQRYAQVPPALQLLSVGFVAECFAQGFIFDEDSAQQHESIFELFSMMVRNYLSLFYLEKDSLEEMVTLFSSPSGRVEEAQPLTLALKSGVGFDHPEVSKAIVESKPVAVIWIGKELGENEAKVSVKALTPTVVGNLDVIFSNDIDLQVDVEPRNPKIDPYSFLAISPILNFENYEDVDEGESDDDQADEAEENSDNQEKEQNTEQ